MLAILLLLLAQMPCLPQEMTTACYCKQGVATACEALRQVNPKLARELEKAAAQAMALKEATRRAAEAAKAQEQASSNAPEPPDCKGQQHHIISRPIAKALQEHPTLRDKYTPRDPRFVTQAVDEEAHCGYQSWHRDVDEEVINWLQTRRRATPEQFESFLRELYSRPELRARFPRGF